MRPEQQDVVVAGKKGLDAFPGTDLEAQLRAHGIETVVLAGFLTNCCVESTMRTAFEKGFNVVTLTDCTATTSKEGQEAAVEGTYGMFSTPMSSADFVAKLGARTPGVPRAANALEKIDSVPRGFAPAQAKGGADIQARKTAALFIEYQNEFTSEGGKLHGAVKEVMDTNDMLKKSVTVASAVRKAGGKVFHAPISFATDASDNPNKGLGILAGCANDKLFIAGTWNAEFCDSMRPEQQDVVVVGKKGLDAFPGTDLEAQLKAHGIETVVLAGFLSNCCVESTMRTAFEKAFNVITLTDCTATTSKEGQKAAVEGTYGMFSTPMSAAEFMVKLEVQ
jgi:nicotinamidase-related amidase